MKKRKRLFWKNDLIRGDIVYVKLKDNTDSCIQSGLRPCVIVSNNVSNRKSKIFNICPFTCQMEKSNIPVHIEVKPGDVGSIIKKSSLILVEQIVTIDKRDVINLIGNIENDSETMEKIDRALVKQLGLSEKISWKNSEKSCIYA